MPVYSVEGKLGTGKTKFAVWRAKLALLEGRRVASNVDLELSKLSPAKAARYIRIPDKPRAFDLEAVGHGNPDSYDEENNGVMILDELGTWLNSRSFQDKDRAGVLDFLIHARKKGWDVYLIVQDSNMIDRQVREALIEYQCRCMRLDKVKIPVLSFVIQALADLVAVVTPTGWHGALRFKRWGFMPRMHLVTSRLGGTSANSVVAERWMYRGDDLHAAYDTRQVFRSDYPHGAHSVRWVPPPPAPTWADRFAAWMAGPPKPAPKAKRPEVRALEGLPRAEAWGRAVQLARQDFAVNLVQLHGEAVNHGLESVRRLG